jgi:UDP-2-acetamido-3-amino-2,3-dideoxy-glucuronate N-acetyltransferase
MNNIAVVGCGLWGKNLVRNFHALGALSHLCDRETTNLVALQEQFAGLAATTDYEAILANPEIKGVALATNAEHHAWMTEAALRAGKDVFVEKPLALRYPDGEKLVYLAEKLDKVLMVGHLLEYHPAVLKLEELIRAGALGKINYIYSNRLNLGRVRREENILWSFAPHDIAVILRFLGNELPLEVTATGGAYLQPNIADVTVTNLLFDNGVRAHIFVSWLHPFKEQKLVVIGSEKMAVFNDTAPPGEKLLLYNGGIDWVEGQPVTRQGQAESIAFDDKEPLRAECEHFLERIASRRPARTNGRSGLRVLRVLQGCQRSLQTNGEPVQIMARQLEVTTI